MRPVLASVSTNVWIIKVVKPVERNFTVVVRFLKELLEKNGISGNKYGFFGGINITILVCFLLQNQDF